MIKRFQIEVRGIVQGIGFRPFVFSLAERHGLTGRVFNDSGGVLIDVEAEAGMIERFMRDLRAEPPPLAVIESISCSETPQRAYFTDFRIAASAGNGPKLVPVSPDVATCDDCLGELFDPRDRRWRYPFINCTNCGPRHTIVEDVPYDRARTTMRDFPMCERCRAEYENPRDRRFHAEPIACPDCGPSLVLSTRFSGRSDVRKSRLKAGLRTGPIESARRMLLAGKILAVKGIGGYHLACDALSARAVEMLRSRKFREDKPFALMAGSVEVIRKYCFVEAAEEDLLLDRSRPIVLLARREGTAIPDSIAPGVDTLGFMLPYAPVHHLLLEDLDRPLVMTSGNLSDEPICYEDEDAFERLKDIADGFLVHNRRIHIRTDDSIVRIARSEGATGAKKRETEAQASRLQTPRERREALDGPERPDNEDSFRAFGLMASGDACAPVEENASLPIVTLRRSRGFAPAPVRTSFEFSEEILACGAELKNTFCLTRGNHAFLSHHIGDLENLETLKAFTSGIEHYKKLFYLEPAAIAYDLHPEYLSTKYALGLDENLAKIGVQHHHAHVASCMAENGIDGEVIGVAMDGLGYGTDGHLWGGEFFVADFLRAERIAHLEYLPMPGGVMAIREPWRMAAVYLHRAFGDDFLDLEIPFVKKLNRKTWATFRQMIATNTNCPQTSSMGRLFDGVAALTGLRSSVRYEGQAAIELEAHADRACRGKYLFEIAENGSKITLESVIRQIAEDLLSGVSSRQISAKFHLGAAELIASVARKARRERQLQRVVLSGGVFQNMFLLEEACRILTAEGFQVFTHGRVPANDGGISLGQAAVANAQLLAGKV